MAEKMTKDELWILEEAAKPGGFTPNVLDIGKHARRMESDGLLYSDPSGSLFYITEAGRRALDEASHDR